MLDSQVEAGGVGRIGVDERQLQDPTENMAMANRGTAKRVNMSALTPNLWFASKDESIE